MYGQAPARCRLAYVQLPTAIVCASGRGAAAGARASRFDGQVVAHALDSGVAVQGLAPLLLLAFAGNRASELHCANSAKIRVNMNGSGRAEFLRNFASRAYGFISFGKLAPKGRIPRLEPLQQLGLL